MNDNLVHISNTPIFDQLSRERNYQRLVAGGPTVRLRPYMAPGAWIAKEMSLPEPNVKLSVNVHPEEAEQSSCGGMYGFTRARIKEFNEKHPNAANVTLTSIPELDGTMTLTITGYEQSGVTLAKKPLIEFKAEKIPEDLAARQLELYRTISKQTDESVNAASTEVMTRPQYAEYRPMWFSDEDNADEE